MQSADNRVIGSEIARRVPVFGEHIAKLSAKYKIDYIVPLETKGALLIDIACGNLGEELLDRIIYPKAIRYFTKEELKKLSILLVDDVFFSGAHLRRIHDRLVDAGISENNIHCITFLDFSTGKSDIDYDEYIHKKISLNILPNPPIERKLTLLHLQKEMLENDMPSVYDHVTFQSDGIDDTGFVTLINELSKTNRFLYYGKRGSNYTGTLLLDDLFTGDWDVPPKVRIWYSPALKKIRISPVGFISCSNNEVKAFVGFERIKIAISNQIQSENDNETIEATYEAISFSCRLEQYLRVKDLFGSLNIHLQIDARYINRYYPKVDLKSIIVSELCTATGTIIPNLPSNLEECIYVQTIDKVLSLVKSRWINQENALPKNRVKDGYTAKELFDKLNGISSVTQIHAALDYCFDYHLLAAFRRKNDSGFSRCYRTTEISDNLLMEELLGIAVIYSVHGETPEWLMNKVFPIVEQVNENIVFDDYLVISKAYFGDVTRIKHSEFDESRWNQIVSPYWDKVKVPDGKGVKYKKSESKEQIRRAHAALNDPRLASFHSTLSAAVFLLEKGGRGAAVLLDILTPGYGGADYISFNLSKILFLGSQSLNTYNRTKSRNHLFGVEEKLKLIKTTFSNKRNVLSYLEKQCSELDKLFLIQHQAYEILRKARPFTDPLFYNALENIKNGILGAVRAVESGYYDGLNKSLTSIGFEYVPRSQHLSVVLKKAQQNIIDPLLYALSGQILSSKYYESRVINEADNYKFALAYDLTGIRKGIIEGANEQSRFDDLIHGYFANWIIAFRGKISNGTSNAGDLRFGFFDSFQQALGAASWLLHHLDQLSNTGKLPIGSKCAGVVITSGDFKSDTMGNLSGKILDTCGHWLKGKIPTVTALDKVSGKIGRYDTSFGEEQVWLLEHDSFNVDRKVYDMVGERRIFGDRKFLFDIRNVSYDRYLKKFPNPWITKH